MDQIFYEIFEQMHRQGPGKPEYTKKAFSFCQLPQNPQILDIGCGTGSQTISLAESTDGLITAVDNHKPFLKQLQKDVKQRKLDSQIKILHADMNQLDLKQNFDLIWSEGAIFIIGFKKGLKEFKKFLKPGGFMALTEVAWIKENPPPEAVSFWEKQYPAIRDIDQNLKIIQNAGYKLIHHFIMPRDAWDEFYSNLKDITKKMKKKYKDNPEAKKTLDMVSQEIEAYEQFGEFYGYVFYILKN